MLIFKKETDLFYIFDLPLTAEQRSKSQNRTFHRLFSEIGSKLWHTTEETKQAMMKGIFWTKTIKICWMWFEISNISSTKKLTKEQAILLINRMIEFWKKLGLWEIIQSAEVRDLFYNIDKNEWKNYCFWGWCYRLQEQSPLARG